MLQNAGTLHVGLHRHDRHNHADGRSRANRHPAACTSNIDPARGRTDLLQISGRAALDGAIVVNPVSVHKGTSGPVITAAGGLTVTPLLQGTTGLVFTHSLLVLGNSLSIATDADFKSNDLSKSTNQRGAAGHLQRIWDSGAYRFRPGLPQSLPLIQCPRLHAGARPAFRRGARRAPPACWRTKAVTCATRCSDACGRRPMAATPAWRRCRSAVRWRRSRTARTHHALAYGKSPLPVKAPLRAPQATSDVVFWAQGFGARGRFETDGNAASLRRDLAGFISGVDTRVGANGRLGIAAGYTGSKNALDGRGTRRCRDRAYRGLWRLELRRVQSARRRRVCVPCDRHRSADRVPGLLRPRDRELRRPAPGRSSASSATASRSVTSRSSRSPAPRGCGSRPTRRRSAAGSRRSTSPARRSRPAMRRSASAPPA